MTDVRRLRFDRDDRAADVYQYVPVDVPADAAGLRATIAYDRTTAVVDLGLFDPEGFRGWSGGARDTLVVTPWEATPGYLPGPLPRGTWHVVLGLHRVPVAGVDVRIEVETGPVRPAPPPPPPPRPERPPSRPLPSADGRTWLAADLHAHTLHSDGALSIGQLASLAAGRGLDVLAVTDHNTVSHHPHLRAAGEHAGIRLLPGQEVTTDRGHANCFGDVGWIDFRRPPDTWLETAEQRGGLLSVNHPLAGDCAWRHRLRRPAPLVEAWHGTWDRRGGDVLDWWARAGGAPVGGSDYHRPGDAALPGAPTTWLAVEDDDVLGALAAGRVALAAGPQGPVLLPHDGALVAVDAQGTNHVDGGGRRTPIDAARVRIVDTTGPHRLVARDGAVVALVA